MSDQKLRRLVLSALFAALCTVMTLVIQVPSPVQGYVNLGDCAVLLSAWALGPLYGGAAAGTGSMLAEALMAAGYFGYACLWLGKGLAAAASVPGNIVQGCFGLAAAVAVYALLDRSRALARI